MSYLYQIPQHLPSSYDTNTRYLGRDGRYIKRNEIPFDFNTLHDLDIIEGSEKGEKLIYIEEDKAYRLLTNCPLSYLTTPFQQWKKI